VIVGPISWFLAQPYRNAKSFAWLLAKEPATRLSVRLLQLDQLRGYFGPQWHPYSI
jgi:hypothetical protein